MNTVQTVVDTDKTSPTLHVEWSAIIAGAIVASAIASILMTFGSGLGLSSLDPSGREGVSPVMFASLVGLWTAWVVVSSFIAGGYLTGRLRSRAFNATEHEVEVRDGAHGLLVWALGVLVAGYLAASGIANVTGSVAKTAGSAISSGGDAAGELLGNSSELMTDTLFRTGGAPSTSADAIEDVRSEISRLLANAAAAGELTEDDQTYLVGVVERVSGVSTEDAQKRVTAVVESLEEAKQSALEAADIARKSGILFTFLVSAILIVSGAASWWSATVGGRHRDEGTDFSHLVHWK